MNDISKKWAPDFIGIGAMKAATYWFYCCLQEHPEICMSKKKEIHFFDTEESYSKGIKWYEDFFTECADDKKQGEVTPDYICSPDVAERIHKHYPDVKLFVCLRNPIERAYSHYRFNVVRKGNMTIYNSFEQAVEKEKTLVMMGQYYEQIQKYYDYFSKENLHIIIYDDIATDSLGVLRRLYEYLGVDSGFVPEVAQTKKGVTGVKSMEYKFPFITPFLFRMRDIFKGGILDAVLGKLGVKKWLQALILKNRRVVDVKDHEKIIFPPLDEEMYRKILPHFEGDIDMLEKLLGRDLSSWKLP